MKPYNLNSRFIVFLNVYPELFSQPVRHQFVTGARRTNVVTGIKPSITWYVSHVVNHLQNSASNKEKYTSICIAHRRNYL